MWENSTEPIGAVKEAQKTKWSINDGNVKLSVAKGVGDVMQMLPPETDPAVGKVDCGQVSPSPCISKLLNERLERSLSLKQEGIKPTASLNDEDSKFPCQPDCPSAVETSSNFSFHVTITASADGNREAHPFARLMNYDDERPIAAAVVRTCS